MRAKRRISKFEGIHLNFIRAINNISKTEGYKIEFRKNKKIQKLTTTHTKEEKHTYIHIYTHNHC